MLGFVLNRAFAVPASGFLQLTASIIEETHKMKIPSYDGAFRMLDVNNKGLVKPAQVKSYFSSVGRSVSDIEAASFVEAIDRLDSKQKLRRMRCHSRVQRVSALLNFAPCVTISLVSGLVGALQKW